MRVFSCSAAVDAGDKCRAKIDTTAQKFLYLRPSDKNTIYMIGISNNVMIKKRHLKIKPSPKMKVSLNKKKWRRG